MRKIKITNNTRISIENSYIGESIERKMERVINNNEAVEAVSPIIYTERKDGVKPEFDIRTDIWQEAQHSMAWVAKQRLKARDKAIAKKQIEVDKPAE